MRSIFRFDELLSLSAATLGCSGVVGLAVGALHGAPRPVLAASILFLAVSAGLCLARRHLRRRARAELMWWLPRTRTENAAQTGWGSDWQGLWRRDELLGDEHKSSGLQMTRPGTATSAVLASLHDAIRAEALAHRTPRPACRRARLRELGRDSSFQRRRPPTRSRQRS